MNILTEKLSLTGIVVIVAGIAVSKVVELLNGATDEFVLGAFGSVAVFAIASMALIRIWRTV